MIKFFIFADARTGGTHITSSLNSHSRMRVVSEPFPHKKLVTWKEQLEWLEAFFKPQQKFDAKGIRMKIEHITHLDEFAKFISKRDVKFFHLKRKNIVKKAISRINAVTLFKKTKDYNLKTNIDVPISFTIGFPKLIAEIDICNKQEVDAQSFFQNLNIHPKALIYEDMLIDEKAFFKKAYNQIGVDYEAPKSNVFKATSDDLKESITNYDELKKKLRKTDYFLDFVERLT